MWDAVLSAPLVTKPDTEVIYSDLGYLALGCMIEKVMGMSLEQAVKERVLDPLGMRHATLTPAPEQAGRYAATEYEDTIQDHLCGIVHDEKARALGGVCGHAGLFATAGDLLQYARMWLAQGRSRNGEARDRRRRIPRLIQGGGDYGYSYPYGAYSWLQPWPGVVLKGDKMDASGDWMGPGCYGHTGFTGTSMWIDPELDLAVVLLTNRVYGDGQQCRPAAGPSPQRIDGSRNMVRWE